MAVAAMLLCNRSTCIGREFRTVFSPSYSGPFFVHIFHTSQSLSSSQTNYQITKWRNKVSTSIRYPCWGYPAFKDTLVEYIAFKPLFFRSLPKRIVMLSFHYRSTTLICQPTDSTNATRHASTVSPTDASTRLRTTASHGFSHDGGPASTWPIYARSTYACSSDDGSTATIYPATANATSDATANAPANAPTNDTTATNGISADAS